MFSTQNKQMKLLKENTIVWFCPMFYWYNIMLVLLVNFDSEASYS